MSLRPVILAAAILCAFVARSADKLLDIDFTSASTKVAAKGLGSCTGVLPAGLSENFASWSEGRCTASLVEEDGVKHLRFAADSSKGTVQFAAYCPAVELPGFFRLTVKGRVRGNPLRLGMRLGPPPYTSFSSHSFDAPDWTEKTYLFQVSKKTDKRVGLFLYLGSGDVDLQRIVLEKVDRSAYARTFRRPPPETRVFVSRRFLLGLPNGWNDDRVTDTGVAAAADDPETSIPVLRISSEKDKTITVWGEPFQTSDPYSPHLAAFRCRGSGNWTAQIVTRQRHVIKSTPFVPSAQWSSVTFSFMPKDLEEAFAVKFTGTGELFLDDLRVGAGKDVPPRPFPSACALAPAAGEIARLSRIWFTDERPRIAWAVADAPAGALLRLSFADLYGRTSHLADVPLKGGRWEKGEVDPSVSITGRTGQFRVTAEVFADGLPVSAPDEFIFTRIVRPLGWGRDMPDSPFGVHMEPRRATIATLKACGINWTRFHDAATWCTGWSSLEAEKGKWTFHDDAIARFRDGNIKIFAQLGTAPAWATHYSDLGCKSMGYFEKYLRPVDTNAWLNYVTTVARRYRGVIDEYFVWNEPWGRWWKSAEDVKFYDKNRTAQDFGALQAMTYRAVKSVDPAILVSGFNTYASHGGGEWSAGVAEGGGWDACDILDYHVYTPNMRGLRTDYSFSALAFSPIIAAHPGLGGKRVYMSEGQGTSTGSSTGINPMSGLYERTIPWKAETPAEMAFCADATCRYTLSLLAAGDTRVFLYTAHGYQGLVIPPSYTVLVGADGYPYPSLAAYSFFTRTLEGRKFAGRADYGANGCEYTFRGEGLRHPVVKIYTALAPAEADALNERNPLRDLYGNLYDRTIWFKGSTLYSFE